MVVRTCDTNIWRCWRHKFKVIIAYVAMYIGQPEIFEIFSQESNVRAAWWSVCLTNMRTPVWPSELSVKMTGVEQGTGWSQELDGMPVWPLGNPDWKGGGWHFWGGTWRCPLVSKWNHPHSEHTHLVILQTHKSKADKSILYFGMLIMFLNDCMFILIQFFLFTEYFYESHPWYKCKVACCTLF